MDQKDIYRLIALWNEGQTTSEQEKLLREYFRDSSEIPDDLKVYQLMFNGFSALSKQTAPVLRKAKIPRVPVRRLSAYVCVAAVFAMLCIAFSYYRKPYCYVDGKPVRNLRVAMNATGDLNTLARFDKAADDLKALEGLATILESDDNDNSGER